MVCVNIGEYMVLGGISWVLITHNKCPPVTAVQRILSYNITGWFAQDALN